MAFLSDGELADVGVRAGRNVLVSSDAQIFGGERLRIGDNVRIDAFCIISTGSTGLVRLGSHIHISAAVRIFGEGSVTLGDFTTISSASTLYSASDDFSGRHLVGPTAPNDLRSVDVQPIVLEDLAAVGAHSIVLPGKTLHQGAVLGAMSLARDSLDPWTIYTGSRRTHS